MNNLEKYRAELRTLISLSDEMLGEFVSRRKQKASPPSFDEGEVVIRREDKGGKFEGTYQRWYTEALVVVKQLIPDRALEFRQLYEADPKRKQVHVLNFAIQDWLVGARASTNMMTQDRHFDDFASVLMRFNAQVDILRSAERRFESRLMDLEQIVRADLFDSEVDAARELLRNGFERASGVVVGVVLEGHLQMVCSKRTIKVAKKNPTIADLNDVLKNEGVVDVTTWRFIQRLGDIRNLCGHKKKRDPTPEEVGELIDGVDKIIKTIG